MSRPFGTFTAVVKADAKIVDLPTGKKVMEWDLLANDQYSKFPIRLRCRSYITNTHAEVGNIRTGCLMSVTGEMNAEAYMMEGRPKPVAVLCMSVTRYEIHPVIVPVPTKREDGAGPAPARSAAAPSRPVPRPAPAAPAVDDGGADDVPF